MNERSAGPTENPPPTTEAERLFAAAVERQSAGDAAGAIGLYARVLALEPDLADPYNNIAILLRGMRHLPAAVACLKRAVQFAPASAPLWSNLGNVLWMARDFDQAMAAFGRALELDQNAPETHHNLGLLYNSLGDHPRALASYDRALALAPGNMQVMWDRALALLASGDLRRGFAAYDVRFDLDEPGLRFDPKLKAARSLPPPLWRGEELSGKTLFVWAEQGFGDTIQFARFLKLAAARGARVIFDCPWELARLMTSAAGVAELRPQFHSNPLPVADFQVPLMSLPGRLGVSLADLPNATPYLAAAPAGPGLPRPRGTRLAIGIVWAGRTEHAKDADRSIALEDLLPLAELPGVALYSLQTGPRAADIAASGAAPLIVDLAPRIQDFADTARLLGELDLVISVDTAVAHLAGALARPGFVLLPYTPDWRWLRGRGDSPWYPTLRLLRQKKPGDWASVLAELRGIVATLLAGG